MNSYIKLMRKKCNKNKMNFDFGASEPKGVQSPTHKTEGSKLRSIVTLLTGELWVSLCRLLDSLKWKAPDITDDKNMADTAPVSIPC